MIFPFVAGWRMHMMSPITFVQNPLLWLELISKHKVNWNIAPDFSYQLVSRKFQEVKASGREPIIDLDLSCITHLKTAAEPCRPETQQLLLENFGPYGLRKDFYISCYGLAENVVGVSFVNGMHLSSPREEDAEKMYVASGKKSLLYPSINLKLVDPVTLREVEDGLTGEIWLSGPTVTSGYYGKEALTESTFHAELKDQPGTQYLRTGDLAFYQSDYLFICGRIKDLIIYNGVNYYPQDIEYAVQDASPSVRPGCIAAFAASEVDNEADVQIVFEIRKASEKDAQAVVNQVKLEIMKATGLPLRRVVAIAERSIPKTTSGKIQRKATRKALNSGILKIIYSYDAETKKDELETMTNASEISSSYDTFTETKTLSFDEILNQVIGGNFNADSSWEELGLASLASIELRDLISSNLFVILPPDFLEEYSTPNALRAFVESRGRKPFRIHPPQYAGDTVLQQQQPLSWTTTTLLQGMGVLFLFLLIAFAFVPAYQLGKFLSSTPSLVVSTGKIRWHWLPIVIPCWMLCFSLLTVMTKWIVIGRYKEQKISVPSIPFVSWWFVDRLISTWEKFVGIFILDTPIIVVFYSMMGAKIHWTVNLDAFVREFDLVEIDKHADVSFGVDCRKFGVWSKEKDALSLRFRPVRIGKFCRVRGYMGLGAILGDRSDVERLAAVPEGAQVPEQALVEGSPAFYTGQSSLSGVPVPLSQSLIKGTVKLAWLLLELYVLFTLFLCGQWVLHDVLPPAFRYTPLLYWVLLLVIQTALSMVLCIILKWTLIGKKQSGPFKASIYSELCDWCVDYHFRSTLPIFDALGENSKFVNIYLWALGMKIDLTSHVWAVHFPPSKVDLIEVSNSFFSTVALDITNNRGTAREPIQSTDSSFGHHCVIKAGANIKSMQIAPHSTLKGDITGNAINKERANGCSFPRDVYILAMLPIVVASTIPAYELFQWNDSVFGSDPLGLGFSVTKFALVLIVQTATWCLMCAVLQRIVVCKDRSASPKSEWKVRSQGLYEVQLAVAFFFSDKFTLSSLFLGTPFMNAYLRLHGAVIEGHLLFFCRSFYDLPLVTFAENTVLDNCVVSAHSISSNGIHVGPSRVAGTIHGGAVVLADTDLSNIPESGPLRVIIPNVLSAKDVEKGWSLQDIESVPLEEVYSTIIEV